MGLNQELGRKVGQCRKGVGLLFPFHDDKFSNTKEYTPGGVFPFKNELFELRQKEQENSFNLADDLFTEPLTKYKILPKLKQSNFACGHAEFHIDHEWGIKNFEDFKNFIKPSVFGLIKKWLGKTNELKANFDVRAT